MKRLSTLFLTLAVIAHNLINPPLVIAAATDDPFGPITNPIPAITSSEPGGGLIIILNNVLRLLFVVAGIFAFLKIRKTKGRI